MSKIKRPVIELEGREMILTPKRHKGENDVTDKFVVQSNSVDVGGTWGWSMPPTKWWVRFGGKGDTTRYAVTKDISWFHRLMMRLLLGWHFERERGK